MLTDRPAILDASTLINLAASGCVQELIRALGDRVLVCRYVKERECLYVRTADGTGTEPLEIQRWVDDGIIEQCELGVDEEEDFVNYAAQIDDGEAMCLAIARSRQLVIVTDDRKGRTNGGRGWVDCDQHVANSTLLGGYSYSSRDLDCYLLD